MFEAKAVLSQFGFQPLQPGACSGEGRWSDPAGRAVFEAVNPADEIVTARIAGASAEDYETLAPAALAAHQAWRSVPPPRRGELGARICDLVEEHQGGVAP